MKPKNRKSVYAKSRDSLCYDCEFSQGIADMERDGSTMMSCKCSIRGITTVKLQTCEDFRLRREADNSSSTDKHVDLLAWTGV